MSTELVLKIEVTIPGLAELVEQMKKGQAPAFTVTAPAVVEAIKAASPQVPDTTTADVKGSDEGLEKAIQQAVPQKVDEPAKVRKPRAPKAPEATPELPAAAAPAPAAVAPETEEIVSSETMRAAYQAACERVTMAKRNIDAEISPLLAKLGDGVKVTQLTDQKKRRAVVDALNALFPAKAAAAPSQAEDLV